MFYAFPCAGVIYACVFVYLQFIDSVCVYILYVLKMSVQTRYACIHTNTHTHAHTHTCIHMCICVYIYIFIYCILLTQKQIAKIQSNRMRVTHLFPVQEVGPHSSGLGVLYELRNGSRMEAMFNGVPKSGSTLDPLRRFMRTPKAARTWIPLFTVCRRSWQRVL